MKTAFKNFLTSRYIINTLDSMPLYEYECIQCGNFTLHRAMERRDQATSCPQCAAQVARSITAPGLMLMSPVRRDAFARNEKSRHEPGVRTTHACGPRCGCGKEKQSGAARNKSTIKVPKLGEFRTPRKRNRPWMLGH
jgi:putative FmdB family regulatory protein